MCAFVSHACVHHTYRVYLTRFCKKKVYMYVYVDVNLRCVCVFDIRVLWENSHFDTSQCVQQRYRHHQQKQNTTSTNATASSTTITIQSTLLHLTSQENSFFLRLKHTHKRKLRTKPPTHYICIYVSHRTKPQRALSIFLFSNLPCDSHHCSQRAAK